MIINLLKERIEERKQWENGILHYEFLEKKLVTQSLIYKLESTQKKIGGKVSYVTNWTSLLELTTLINIELLPLQVLIFFSSSVEFNTTNN
jgi:hypothetical protein